MSRIKTLLLVAAVGVAACSSDGAGSGSVPADSTDTTGSPVTTTTGPGSETTATVPDTTPPPETSQTTSGRPLAPDFTLELGDGGQYRLSEGAKPVYLVFWAEW